MNYLGMAVLFTIGASIAFALRSITKPRVYEVSGAELIKAMKRKAGR